MKQLKELMTEINNQTAGVTQRPCVYIVQSLEPVEDDVKEKP